MYPHSFLWRFVWLAPQAERELSQFVPSHNLERWNAELERVLQR